jgi:antitoxin (DNA-binding transcriptional repressor) of toxin-antitoxin stability system
MQFITTSALRDPKAWNRISRGRAMVTKGGRPIAIVIPVTESTFESALEESSRVEALGAMRRMQEQAIAQGTNQMTDAEIQAEITAARAERKARRARRS